MQNTVNKIQKTRGINSKQTHKFPLYFSSLVNGFQRENQAKRGQSRREREEGKNVVSGGSSERGKFVGVKTIGEGGGGGGGGY